MPQNVAETLKRVICLFWLDRARVVTNVILRVVRITSATILLAFHIFKLFLHLVLSISHAWEFLIDLLVQFLELFLDQILKLVQVLPLSIQHLLHIGRTNTRLTRTYLARNLWGLWLWLVFVWIGAYFDLDCGNKWLLRAQRDLDHRLLVHIRRCLLQGRGRSCGGARESGRRKLGCRRRTFTEGGWLGSESIWLSFCERVSALSLWRTFFSRLSNEWIQFWVWRCCFEVKHFLKFDFIIFCGNFT